MNFKNLLLFYFILVTPLICLLLLVKEGQINSKTFAIFMIFYLLIYHPFISGIRLVQSGKISGSKYWYNFIPGWNVRHFRFLFFNK